MATMMRDNLEGSVLREIGGDLRELREGRGMSLRDVTSLMDEETLTPQALSRIELGQRIPSSRALVALAKAYEVRFVATGAGITIED